MFFLLRSLFFSSSQKNKQITNFLYQFLCFLNIWIFCAFMKFFFNNFDSSLLRLLFRIIFSVPLFICVILFVFCAHFLNATTIYSILSILSAYPIISADFSVLPDLPNNFAINKKKPSPIDWKFSICLQWVWIKCVTFGWLRQTDDTTWWPEIGNYFYSRKELTNNNPNKTHTKKQPDKTTKI